MYFTLNGANVLTFITSHYIFNLGHNYRINVYVEAFQDQKQDLNKSSVFFCHMDCRKFSEVLMFSLCLYSSFMFLMDFLAKKNQHSLTLLYSCQNF